MWISTELTLPASQDSVVWAIADPSQTATGLGEVVKVTLGSLTTALTAPRALTSGNCNPFLWSVSSVPVPFIKAMSSLGVLVGATSRIRLATPAAAGDAKEVPAPELAPPPKPDASNENPGATKSISALLLVKQTIVLESVEASKQSGLPESRSR